MEFGDAMMTESKIRDNFVYTENGDVALKSTGSVLLDFYDKCVRNIPKETIDEKIMNVFEHDELRIDFYVALFNIRDVRNGKGERQIFYYGMTWALRNDYKNAVKLLVFIPEFGYYKDYINLLSELKKYDEMNCVNASNEIFNLWMDDMRNDMVKYENAKTEEERKNLKLSLAWKYAPAEKSAFRWIYKELRTRLKIPASTYRKVKSGIGRILDVVEIPMSEKRFTEINYEHVPSKAMNLYKWAFKNLSGRRHNITRSTDEDRILAAQKYSEYLSAVQRGEKKINAGVLQPHELVGQYLKFSMIGSPSFSPDTVIEEQWKELVKTVKKSDFSELRAISVVDVSGSMSCDDNLPMKVAVSMGLMLCEIQPVSSPFRDQLITFTETPEFHRIDLKQSLYEKVKSISNMKWGMNTDFYAVIELIVSVIKKYKISPDKIPKNIFVFSDMQFDQAERKPNKWSSNYEKLVEMFSELGPEYQIPKFIYWNLRGNTPTYVADSKQPGVAMLSGFSPHLFKAILSGDSLTEFTPIGILTKIINEKRYNVIREKLDSPSDYTSPVDHAGAEAGGGAASGAGGGPGPVVFESQGGPPEFQVHLP